MAKRNRGHQQKEDVYTIDWFYNGHLHRADGPARISKNKYYYADAYFLHGHYFHDQAEWEWCVKNTKHIYVSQQTGIVFKDNKKEIEYKMRFK